MSQTKDRQREKRAFTIVELLTVMSIIVILISILVPALNKVRRYALDVKERAQLHAIGTGVEAFSAENDGYPDSNGWDGDPSAPLARGYAYCGAMKLAEAMVGQDLRGFNPDSRFRRNGFPGVLLPEDAPWDGMPYPPYNTIGVTVDLTGYAENIKKRKTYLQLENANATQIRDIWTVSDIKTYSGFEPNSLVLCDVYSRATSLRTGKKIGMPVLYYKADTTKTVFPTDSSFYNNSNCQSISSSYIYDYRDNYDLVYLPIPWDTSHCHPMACFPSGWTPEGGKPNPWLFYQKISNKKMPSSNPWPYRADTFILMSAGYDGEYGTGDDIFNFGE
jgi:prepilin-type N-terminal cleavage/methylation domain-containing protein